MQNGQKSEIVSSMDLVLKFLSLFIIYFLQEEFAPNPFSTIKKSYV